MFFTIANVLDDAATVRLRGAVSALEWRDGAATAGAVAKRVKRNLQAVATTKAGEAIRAELMNAIRGNAVFMAAAQPAKFSPLMLSKTRDGGGYGAHVDNALMGDGEARLRTDLSFTLFLSEPDSYEGGALMMDLPSGVQSVKPAAGDLVLYPSTLIHEVETVTRGERLAAVGWVQSEVRGEAERQVLFDLEQVRVAIRAKAPDNAPERLILDKAIANMLRMWSNP